MMKQVFKKILCFVFLTNDIEDFHQDFKVDNGWLLAGIVKGIGMGNNKTTKDKFINFNLEAVAKTDYPKPTPGRNGKFMARFSLNMLCTRFCGPASDNPLWNYLPSWYFNPRLVVDAINDILKQSLRSKKSQSKWKPFRESFMTQRSLT